MKKFFKSIAIVSGVVAVIVGALALVLSYIVSHDDGTSINWDNYNF